MKKLVSLTLVLAMMFSFSASALAVEPIGNIELIDDNISTENVDLLDVDVYIVSTDNPSDEINYVELYEQNATRSVVSVNVNSNTVVQKLTNTQKHSNEPLLKLVKQHINSKDYVVNDVTIILPKSNTLFSDNVRTTSDDYWYTNSTSYGTYSGYRFRYIDMKFNQSSDELKTVEITNISVGTAVKNILLKTVKFFIEEYVDKAFKGGYSRFIDVSSILSQNISSSIQNLPVEFTNLNHYYNETTRTIIIEDKLNKDSVYEYTPWGYCQQLKIFTTMDIMYTKANGESDMVTSDSPEVEYYNTSNYNDPIRMMTNTYNYYVASGYTHYREYLEYYGDNILYS